MSAKQKVTIPPEHTILRPMGSGVETERAEDGSTVCHDNYLLSTTPPALSCSGGSAERSADARAMKPEGIVTAGAGGSGGAPRETTTPCGAGWLIPAIPPRACVVP